MVIKRKTGVLHTKERAIIVKLLEEGKSPEEIGLVLNRTAEPIEKFIALKGLKDKTLKEDNQKDKELQAIARLLHCRRYWRDVVEQFDRDEQRRYESEWTNLYLQFNEDVKESEEMQIHTLLTMNILMGRSMKDRKRHTDDMEKLQKTLDKEYKKGEDDRDITLIASLETQLSFARNSLPSYTTEYTKLQDSQQKILKELKATRDARIKRVEDSQSSWTGYLREIEDERTRLKVGDEAEIYRLAKVQSIKLLSEYHIYGDSSIDQPLLNYMTAKIDEDESIRPNEQGDTNGEET